MKKQYVKRTMCFLGILIAAFVFVHVSRTVMEVVDISYTMNALWNLKPFQKALFEYQKQHGEFPEASTLENLKEILDIHDYPFKKSNPSLHEIQYFCTVAPDRPFLFYWESNEKWGIFRYLRPKHRRHQILVMWEDGEMCYSSLELDELIRQHKKHLERLENQRKK